MTPFIYQISGLLVHSELELPSARERSNEARPADVVIHAGVVPESIHQPLYSAVNWQSSATEFLFRVDGVACFLIRAGREIVYELVPGASATLSALYVLGSCFAILMQQRGTLVLHASAVVVNGRAVLFCGESGAGKSTLAAMLGQRGFAVLNDDVCGLNPLGDGAYEVSPDGRMLKLWDTSMDELELRTGASRPVRKDIEKYFCTPPVSETQARPVGAVYLLHRVDQDEPAAIQRLTPLQAMAELKRCAYRPALIAAMKLESAYFAATAALQRGAGVYRLSRPFDFQAAEALLHLLEGHWQAVLGPAAREASR